MTGEMKVDPPKKQITLRVPEHVLTRLQVLWTKGGPRAANDQSTLRTFAASFLDHASKQAEIQLRILEQAWEEEKEQHGY